MKAADEIVTALREREPVFHNDPPGADREYLEELIAEDYFEVGGSGRIYSRDRVIDTVVDRYEREEPPVEYEVDEFEVRQIAPHIFLATYTLSQPDGHETRVTRRSTIWTDAGERWQVVYHQGTVVAP
ncbi:MAG: DUF4440 domain-containing protein [Solirubrobacteraceae bacterium]|nr:DUF4440 domain-containing protein [Solirubrobacteraceae bacterium]